MCPRSPKLQKNGVPHPSQIRHILSPDLLTLVQWNIRRKTVINVTETWSQDRWSKIRGILNSHIEKWLLKIGLQYRWSLIGGSLILGLTVTKLQDWQFHSVRHFGFHLMQIGSVCQSKDTIFQVFFMRSDQSRMEDQSLPFRTEKQIIGIIGGFGSSHLFVECDSVSVDTMTPCPHFVIQRYVIYMFYLPTVVS